jgi:hypothetical protein
VRLDGLDEETAAELQALEAASASEREVAIVSARPPGSVLAGQPTVVSDRCAGLHRCAWRAQVSLQVR